MWELSAAWATAGTEICKKLQTGRKVMKPRAVGAMCEKLGWLGEQTPSNEDLALAEFSCDLLAELSAASALGGLGSWFLLSVQHGIVGRE